ncbi:uncharacterized protein [Rutidosis leptorrhynchoides]|uniref:uncharacterized protein n=1 Tax=Rutidosis leptorrhynchoides TaxID=125765 RepID=UPI003A99FB05
MPKIALFLWQLGHQRLATKDILRSRGTNHGSQCPNENFFQWFFRMHDLLDINSYISLNIGLWITWKNRNDAWSNSLCATPQSAATLVMHIKALPSRSASLSNQPQPSSSRGWIPPPQGTVKVNSDAALFKGSGCWGLGIVLRDHLGKTIFYKSLFEQGIMDILYAEAVALLQGILVALSLDFSHVIVESDALMVVNDALSTGPSFLSCRDVIFKIRSLAKNFISCNFVYVPRTGNLLAHHIANLRSNGQGRLHLL